MSDEIVTTVKFTQRVGPYSTNDTVGLAPEVAEDYARRGFATIIKRNVPRVDPLTRAHDARRRAAELRQLAVGLEAEATTHQVEAAAHK